MSLTEVSKPSIVEVFNAMHFSCNSPNSVDPPKTDEAVDVNKTEEINELGLGLKITSQPKPFDGAIDAAVKAQNEWKNSSSLKRANSMHRIWENLRDFSKSLSSLKNELLSLANHFDFYTDLAVHIEEYKNWKSYGVILVVLSDYSPFFILGTTIPPALAAGSSVVVLIPEKIKVISLFLEKIILQAGAPKGLYNTVTDFSCEVDFPVSKEISKVFFCGSYSSATKLYTRNVMAPFSFCCPGNTAAFILESGDLDAAVDKIVTERCGKNSLFEVSTVVIQESIWKFFLEKLKFRIQVFMNTNKSSTFKNPLNIERANQMMVEAINAGAFVEKCIDYEKRIGQIITVNHQNQDTDEDVPVLKVLLCRTAREGVQLLNNCRYNLGTSIWSEFSSQALEISSQLICPNVWINCHGVFEAGEPLQLSGCSGNCVLGGSDGILEYLSFGLGQATDVNKSNEKERLDTEKVNSAPTAISAQTAFNTWQHVNRRECIRKIANVLEGNKELSSLSEVIIGFAHLGNLTTFTQRNSQGRWVLKRKVPIGVFLLLVNTTNIDLKSFASLITAIIAFGNAVKIVLKEVNAAVNMLIKNFNNFLPKNLISVIVGIENGIHLASDSHIQAIWISDETAASAEFLETIKSHSKKSLKHICIVPKNIPLSQHFFQKECLRNQIVWLTNVDQFP